MSLNGDRKVPKLTLSLRKVANRKNVEEYFSNSEYDTTSTGSNESECSTAPSKPVTPEPSSKSLKTSKVKSASKTLGKKLLRHFPTVERDEEVLNRYSCALLGDILLQGRLYITKNYFAFYSNVFGYVTKILIPIITVEKITKEKTARIVPNAIGIATNEQKHVFGSFMSRDNTLQYIRNVWETAKSESPSIMESEIIEEDLDSSEFEEAEDGRDSPLPEDLNQEVSTTTDLPRPLKVATKHHKRVSRHRLLLTMTTLLLILLYLSASVLLYRISQMQSRYSTVLKDVTGTDADVMYSQLIQWQAQMYSKSDGAVYSYLDTNLNQIAKVKQSLEALSSLLINQSPSADENSSSERANEIL